MECVFIFESYSRQGPVRICVPPEQPQCFLVRNDDGNLSQRFRTTDVIGVEVAVDKVSDRFFASHLFNRLPDVRRVGLWRIHYDDATVIDEKHRLNLVVRDHVEAVPEILQTVPFGGVDGGPLSRSRYVEVFSGSYPYRRDCGHVRIGLSGDSLLGFWSAGLRMGSPWQHPTACDDQCGKPSALNTGVCDNKLLAELSSRNFRAHGRPNRLRYPHNNKTEDAEQSDDGIGHTFVSFISRAWIGVHLPRTAARNFDFADHHSG